MGKLARVCAVLAVWLGALAAYPQAAVISSQVIDQNGQPLPFALVRVCSATSTNTPCTPTTPIFQDYNLTIPASDPWTTDQYGNYTLYAPALPAPNLYVVQVSPASGTTWSYVWNGPYCSLSGCTINGNVIINGNLTVNGNLIACTVNGVYNATCGIGADIGAKINSSLALCGTNCTVYVPAGSYNYSTTIVLPLKVFSNYTLALDQGTILNYTGSGDAIQAPIVGGANVTNWKLHGGQLTGTSAAASGVHVFPSNSTSITGMLINGFTNGPGIWLEGANGVTVFDNTIQGNQNGIKISPTYCNGATCGTGVSGSPFSPNQIAILSNRITNNTQWGFLSSDPVTSELSGAQNLVIAFNDMEINGTGGSQYGALSIGRSHGAVIEGNYFEGSPQQIVLGIPGGADGNQFRFFASQGTQILGNFFTDVTATPYDINLLDTADITIQGNTSNQVSQNSSNCSINTLANTGTNIGETGTVYGKNHFEHYNSMGNLLCIAGSPVAAFVGAGSYSQLNQNYFLQMVNNNYSLVSSGTSETVAVGGNTVVGSGCLVGPYNSAAVATALASTYVLTGPNTGTLTHPSGAAGARVNIFCTGAPN